MMRLTFKKLLRMRAYTEQALLKLIGRTPFRVVANRTGPTELSITIQKVAAV